MIQCIMFTSTTQSLSPWDPAATLAYVLDLDDRRKKQEKSAILRTLHPYSGDHKAQRGEAIVACGFGHYPPTHPDII